MNLEMKVFLNLNLCYNCLGSPLVCGQDSGRNLCQKAEMVRAAPALSVYKNNHEYLQLYRQQVGKLDAQV